MSKTRVHLAAVAIGGALAAGLCAPAFAQEAGATPPAPAPGAHRDWRGGGDPAQFKARMEERRARRLQTLHDAIGLRPDQEAAWQAFVADSKPAMQGREHGRRGPDGGGGQGEQARAPLTTPERLDRMSQRMGEMQARLAQRAAAVKRLYTALDPRQQKTFDALFSLGRRGHFGHGGFGRGEGWRG